MRRGILTVVSGFSGAGKGTVMKRLLEKYDSYALSVSATTRPPREGEQEGREYFFKTTEAFLEMIEKEELVEYARYVDNFYGTPKVYVEQQLADGKDVILEIEIQGARKIKEKIPDAVLIFITSPSMEELKRRLLGRGTESEEIIQARLERAQKESSGMEDYDYLIINDDLDLCVEDVHHIICGEHRRTGRNKEFMKQIQGELKGEQ